MYSKKLAILHMKNSFSIINSWKSCFYGPLEMGIVGKLVTIIISV